MQNNGNAGRTDAQLKAQLNNLALGHAANYDRARNTFLRADGQNSKINDSLVGDIDPVRIARRETPVHRTMVNMAAAGYTNREIALLTGYNATTVATAIKQPHAREYLVKEAKKTVQDEIRALLEGEALPSIRKLVEVRDNPKSRGSDVITASDSILNRFLGKAAQPILEIQKLPSDMTDAELRAKVESELTASQPN